ncbi:MAG TPA: NAD(P)-dependent oxidoreductase, partial [Pirellulaceae bacterium]|nr:NAD(P)-dependent oxidoreductase [Pirellulaceae bacterium]
PPTTPETVNLINRQTLAQMKPGAVLVNTARGAVVDADALCEALDRGQLFGAALDVFKIEPLPTTSPLLKYDSVVLCTHMGGMDHDSAIATSSLAAQCIVDLYHGRWPEACAVNRELRERWKW